MSKFYNILDEFTDDCVVLKKILDEFYPNEETECHKSLAETMKVFAETDLRFKAEQKALETIRETLNEKPAEDIEKLFMETLEPIGEDDYKSHDNWCTVFNVTRREVQEVVVEQQEVVYEELNDSLACSTALFKPPIDCISKTIIRDPYRNQKCNHIYEKRFIFEYIKKMKKKARCPFIGCGNDKFKSDDLIPDDDLKQKIDEYLKNNNQKQEESDSE